MHKENSAIARPLFLFGTKGSWKAIFTATVFIGDEKFSQKNGEDFPPRRLTKGNIGTGREKKIFSIICHTFPAASFAISFLQHHSPYFSCSINRHKFPAYSQPAHRSP
ncbi:hypothetical protein CEXT_536031 [Caerostris extrusa]|uniref:Uncharacterized protein n=1 Tax=Caerostris extrusa TaxID=172846 RepID=A0AAV4QKP1_CAEEX|nr:hypothetical protein CEXT_536031 [Caerostris extrusa]